MSEAAVFISYRRSDTANEAASLRDALARHWGGEKVFLDQADIPAGTPYPDALRARIAACPVLLALIGPAWLKAKDKQGNLRLGDPDDWVRQELAYALESDTIVVPVLVKGAQMPREPDLPPALARLATIQAFSVSGDQLEADAHRLAQSVEALLLGRYGTPSVRAQVLLRRWLRAAARPAPLAAAGAFLGILAWQLLAR